MLFFLGTKKDLLYLINNISSNISKSPNIPINDNTSQLTRRPIIINGLEIAVHDLPNQINWNDAQISCNNLGDGWRLPTKEELDLLFTHRRLIGNFFDNYYLSSTELDPVNVWVCNFSNGTKTFRNKRYKKHARIVRDMIPLTSS